MQDAYGNYFFLLPPLDEEGSVLRELLISLNASKFAILHDNTSNSRVISTQLTKPFRNRVTEAVETTFDTLLPFNALRGDVITYLTRLKLRDVRVIVLSCQDLLADVVFRVAQDLQVNTNGYLWIVSEGVLRTIEQLQDSGYHGFPTNLIGITVGDSLTKTG